MMCGNKSSAIANDSGDPRKKYGVSLKVFVLLGLYKMIQMLFIGTIRMKTYKHTSCKLVRNKQKSQKLLNEFKVTSAYKIIEQLELT